MIVYFFKTLIAFMLAFMMAAHAWSGRLCLCIIYGNNRAEVAPRLCGLVLFDRCSRHMKCGFSDV